MSAETSQDSHRHSRVVAGVLVGGCAVLVILPDLLRLDAYVPFAQLVAFRPVLVVVGLAAAALIALRRSWRLTAAGLGLVAMLGGAQLVPRAVAGGPAVEPAPGAHRLTVLALNVKEGSADLDTVAGMIRRLRPDLVSLPESGPDYAGALRDALRGSGFLVRRLTFVAFHAAAPVPTRMDGWVGDLQRLRQWCAAPGPAIIAGDFNATLDHSVLRRAMSGCRDVAAEVGRGLVGTWPSRLPRWLGPQIDHVLVTESLAPVSLDVRDVPGTNHRALVAGIARTGDSG